MELGGGRNNEFSGNIINGSSSLHFDNRGGDGSGCELSSKGFCNCVLCGALTAAADHRSENDVFRVDYLNGTGTVTESLLGHMIYLGSLTRFDVLARSKTMRDGLQAPKGQSCRLRTCSAPRTSRRPGASTRTWRTSSTTHPAPRSVSNSALLHVASCRYPVHNTGLDFR